MKAVVENSAPVTFSRSLFTTAALDLESFPHNVDNLVDIIQSPTGATFGPVDESYAQGRCDYFSSFPGAEAPVDRQEGNRHGRTLCGYSPFLPAAAGSRSLFPRPVENLCILWITSGVFFPQRPSPSTLQVSPGPCGRGFSAFSIVVHNRGQPLWITLSGFSQMSLARPAGK